jgi:hypothetical protein
VSLHSPFEGHVSRSQRHLDGVNPESNISDVGLDGSDAIWEFSTRGLKNVVHIPPHISIICGNLHLEGPNTHSNMTNNNAVTDSTEPPSPVGDRSFLRGPSTPRSPFLPTIVLEVDEANNPSFGSTTRPGGVPTLLRLELLAPSIFQESLLTGLVLPDPLNETGWYTILDMPEAVSYAHTCWVNICIYLGTSSRWDEHAIEVH